MTSSAVRINLEKSNNIYLCEFGSIWITHFKRIKHLCYQWLNGNSELINDAMSLASEKAFRYFCSCSEPINNYFSWLYKLTYHVCMDIHRGLARQQDIVNQVTSLPDSFYFSDNTSEPLDEQMAREFSFDFLIELLGKLPDEMKQVIKYRFIEDMDYGQMARILNTNQANVRKRVQLARQRLRDDWEGYGH